LNHPGILAHLSRYPRFAREVAERSRSALPISLAVVEAAAGVLQVEIDVVNAWEGGLRGVRWVWTL